MPLVAARATATFTENKAAMDRVLFATSARSADFDRLLRDGAWPAVDLRSTVLLANAPGSPATARRPGKARIVSYRNTEVIVEVDSPDGGWLVLNDLWHRWWFAEVDDGRPAELLRANVLFRAVVVPGRAAIRCASNSGLSRAPGLSCAAIKSRTTPLFSSYCSAA